MIGLACNSPSKECFCTSFDCGPANYEDMDLMLTEIENKYYVDVVTEKGKKLVNENKDFFTEPSESEKELRKKIHDAAKNKILYKIDIKELQKKIDSFESKFLIETIARCLGCGICTYLCPTCHCFDIQDEILVSEGSRVKLWDSCMYPEYTLQASGENPRPTRKERLKNRFYHKYKWYQENFNMYSCVGCGRCIKSCPVNIDVREIIEKIMVVKE